jgi:hypothetical protein
MVSETIAIVITHTYTQMFLRRLSQVFNSPTQSLLQQHRPILAPWEKDVPQHWLGRENELKEFILSLSGNMKSFLLTREVCNKILNGQSFPFDRNSETTQKLIKCMRELDPRLDVTYKKLVPDKVSDETFWYSYLFLMQVILRCRRIHHLPRIIAKLQQIAYKTHVKDPEFSLEKEQLAQQETQAAVTPDNDDIIEVKSFLSSFLGNNPETREKRASRRKKQITSRSDTQQTDLIWSSSTRLKQTKSQKHLAFLNEDLDNQRAYASVLDAVQRTQLCKVLPVRLQREAWVLLYNTRKHGTSIKTLFNRCENEGELLFVVQTTRGVIFGAFLGESLTRSSRFYGNGESFLFTFAGKGTDKRLRVYKWSKNNLYFIRSTEQDGIVFGGGEDGKCGLCIEPDLLHGYSYPCVTYGNECLNGQFNDNRENEHFEILVIEVWGFTLNCRLELQ